MTGPVRATAFIVSILLLAACSSPAPEVSTTGDWQTTTTLPATPPAVPVDTPELTTTTVVQPAVQPTTVPPTTIPPAPPPAPVAAAGSVEAIIHDVFGAEGHRAVRVFTCESGLDPNAISPTNDHGVAQIHAGSPGFPGGWQAEFAAVTGQLFFDGVYDPVLNVQFAHWLWSRSGWTPWACRYVL